MIPFLRIVSAGILLAGVAVCIGFLQSAYYQPLGRQKARTQFLGMAVLAISGMLAGLLYAFTEAHTLRQTMSGQVTEVRCVKNHTYDTLFFVTSQDGAHVRLELDGCSQALQTKDIVTVRYIHADTVPLDLQVMVGPDAGFNLHNPERTGLFTALSICVPVFILLLAIFHREARPDGVSQTRT